MTDATPEVASEVSQQPSVDSSDVQVIVILDSPEMGFHGQSASETAFLVDLGEVPQTPMEVQEDIPSEQITGRSDKAISTQARCSNSLLPDRLLLNSYIPPQGQAPPMEEMSVPGPEGAQDIIYRWRPFNRGESSAAHMHQLYSALLRMLVAVWAEGRGKEYAISISAYACKDELKHVVEEGMLIRNHNFVQSSELVCLQLLHTIQVLFPSYCLILMRSVIHYGYPEYNLTASRILV